MCHAAVLPLSYRMKKKKAAPGSGRILLHGKEGRTAAQEFLTSMLVSATGQIISFHVILVVRPAGENLG